MNRAALVSCRAARVSLILLGMGCGSGVWGTVGGAWGADDSPPSRSAEKGAPNRLARETSPYLLAHARNPVQWFPWCDEAFAKARQENKLVFLSVGYSSCHWCHVMERESFCDPEIAAFVNEHYVCVKVDREERPDVDSIYMTALQVYNQSAGNPGGGGWPMSMFLTPEGKPFFGGTYFPPRDGDRGARVGFLTVLRRVHDLWRANEPRLRSDAETLTKLVQAQLDGQVLPDDAATPNAPPTADMSHFYGEVLAALARDFDPQYGGFGYVSGNLRSPKFPEPANLQFLLDLAQAPERAAEERERARRMLLTTLDAMARGGIRDHLGGGFHRYTVDRAWKIPHFEKMLYDNAQLASIYAEAFAWTGEDEYRRTTSELLDFVERELTSPAGAFYSAIDADSEEEEGKYYRWEKAEFERLVPTLERAPFATLYGFDREPNFEDQYFVPQRSQSWPEAASAFGLTVEELRRRTDSPRARLLSARQQRVRPLTDTKILASWNGLMIRGYADAGRLLRNPAYTATAQRAAEFAWTKLRSSDGRLWRSHRDQPTKLNAYLDDYAFLVNGFLAIHRATGEEVWLANAEQLMTKQIELFWDEARGGFFFTSGDHESLIARGRDPADGAEPAGNSVSAENLVYLAQARQRPEYRQRAERTIRSIALSLRESPSSSPRMAMIWRQSVSTTPRSAGPQSAAPADGSKE